MTTANATKKRTRFNLVKNVTWDMCKSMPNVSLAEEYDFALRPMNNAAMLEILYNAAIANRGWQFFVVAANKFYIYESTSEDAEEMAHVELEWSRRAGEYIPNLYAWRTPSTRRRSGQFSHKEAAPILRKIREHVYPKTDAEVVSDATRSVGSRLYNVSYFANQEVSETATKMCTAALAFALDPQFKEMFLHYEATHGVAAKRNTAEAMEKHEAARRRSQLADQLKNGAGDTHALMARLDNGWCVKYQNAITKHEDGSLPEQFSNVHALKLVDKEVVLDGMGVKIDDKTFVVVVNQ
jgi:hypothetical protein